MENVANAVKFFDCCFISGKTKTNFIYTVVKTILTVVSTLRRNSVFIQNFILFNKFPQHESQYVLSGDFNAQSIREFIANFTNKDLKRSLRSHVYETAHTHYFGSDGASEQMGINSNSVYVEDLTSRSFRRMVKTPGTVSHMISIYCFFFY